MRASRRQSELRLVSNVVFAALPPTDVAAADARPKLPRFSMEAYTGGKLDLWAWKDPVVIDLAGMQVSAKSRPILLDHSTSDVVGHTEKVDVSASMLKVDGVVSGTGGAAAEVVGSARNGFPWQASIGARANRIELVKAGETAEANGRTFGGPLYVVRASTLKEVSFVALGADDDTTARIAARDRGSAQGSTAMARKARNHRRATTVPAGNRPKSLIAAGGADVDIRDRELEAAEAAEADGDVEADAGDEAEAVEAGGADPDAAAADDSVEDEDDAGIEASGDAGDDDDADGIAGTRRRRAAELERIAAVERVCRRHPRIAAAAIRGGWTVEKAELHVLRASRASASPMVGAGRAPVTAKVLEAAIGMSVGQDEKRLVADLGERSMEAAAPLRHMGLRDLCMECARIEGQDVPRVFGDGSSVIRASFTTLSLPVILGNTLRRALLAAYEAVEVVALELCSVSSVNDFKEVKRTRLLANGTWDRVGDGGELKSTTFGEQSYGNAAETFGEVATITRKDVVNDDLGAFLQIGQHFGMAAAATIDFEFVKLLLSNPGSFFSVGNKNFLSGADTAFGADALTAAKAAFRKLKVAPSGGKSRPINVRPTKIFSPVEIETDVDILLGSAQLMLDGSSSKTKMPTDNPHRGKYRNVSHPNLSDDTISGYSAKAWYLFADPALVAAFDLAFLNGRREPTVERVPTAQSTQGLSWQGYIDFGVREQDPRGAIKVKGEA